MNKMSLWGRVIPYNTEELDFKPSIKYYEANSSGCVIVFAGGGYETKAEHEGPQMCEWLQSIGIKCFNVDYRVSPYRHPAEISDAQRAVRLIRRYAQGFNIDPHKIAVMGFSAGGHLAASVSVHYDKKMYDKTDDIDTENARPDASILCYPVIDMFDFTHEGSRDNLLGANPTDDEKRLMALHTQVTHDTPQTFLWHTAEDETVPVENTLLYAKALSRAKVPFEVHIYPYGHHGLGLAGDEPHAAQWTKSLNNWLKLIKWKN